jgi:two-component system chemotaxis response regulator CheY
MLRIAVRIAVEALGHQVIDAANGDEALDAARSNNLDLIILDWVMPGKSGLETLKELRAMPRLLETPVVLLTVVKDAQAIREAGVYNVRDYLSKPARPDRLRAKIQKYLV